MQYQIRKLSTLIAAAASLSVAACGHGNNNQQSAAGDLGTPSSSAAPAPSSDVAPSYGSTTAAPADTAVAPQHHSKLGGALVGAAAGHMLGHHALAGAAAGAFIQHERNKHQR